MTPFALQKDSFCNAKELLLKIAAFLSVNNQIYEESKFSFLVIEVWI